MATDTKEHYTCAPKLTQKREVYIFRDVNSGGRPDSREKAFTFWVAVTCRKAGFTFFTIGRS